MGWSRLRQMLKVTSRRSQYSFTVNTLRTRLFFTFTYQQLLKLIFSQAGASISPLHTKWPECNEKVSRTQGRRGPFAHSSGFICRGCIRNGGWPRLCVWWRNCYLCSYWHQALPLHCCISSHNMAVLNCAWIGSWTASNSKLCARWARARVRSSFTSGWPFPRHTSRYASSSGYWKAWEGPSKTPRGWQMQWACQSEGWWIVQFMF